MAFPKSRTLFAVVAALALCADAKRAAPPPNAWSKPLSNASAALTPPGQTKPQTATTGAWGLPKATPPSATTGAWGLPKATPPSASTGAWGRPRSSAPPSPLSMVPATPTRKHLSVMTWNIENLNSNAPKAHVDFVLKDLKKFIKEEKPSVILLQEVESCDMVEEIKRIGYACINSVVSPKLEARLSFVTLGNIILYQEDLFTVAGSERFDVKRVKRNADAGGKRLTEHHSTECTWSGLGSGNGCSNVGNDMQDFTSVLLNLRRDKWHPTTIAALPGGLRAVNIHLFSGAKRTEVSDEAKGDRRAFQLRSILATVALWNKALGSTPVTFYAGDFNTRGANDMKGLVRSEADYGVKLMCPADNGACSDETTLRKTSRGGFLDHIAVDSTFLQAVGGGKVLKQKKKGSKTQISDHSPLFVKMQASADAPTPTAPPSINSKEDFPDTMGMAARPHKAGDDEASVSEQGNAADGKKAESDSDAGVERSGAASATAAVFVALMVFIGEGLRC